MSKKIFIAVLIIAMSLPAIVLADTAEVYMPEIYVEAVTVRTLAGTGAHGAADGRLAQFNLPAGVFGGLGDSIFITDTANNLIRMINLSSGSTYRLTGAVLAFDDHGMPVGFHNDGELAYALFNHPTDGLMAEDGRIFITDSLNHVIRVIHGAYVYTFAGTGVAGMQDGPVEEAMFNHPAAIAVDEFGHIYIADTLNHVIRMIDRYGEVTTLAGVPGTWGYENGSAYEALFNSPMGIAVSADGSRVYVADTDNHLIRLIENGEVSTLAGRLRLPGEEEIALLEFEDDDWAYLPQGGFEDGKGDYALFNLPMGLTLYGDILIVADSANHAIRSILPSGEVNTLAGTGFPGHIDGMPQRAAFHMPAGLFVIEDELFIADRGNNLIRIILLTGGGNSYE